MRWITGSAAPRMRRPSRLPAGVIASCLVLAACGGSRAGGPAAGRPGIEVRSAQDHPRLGLVARQGDPFAAVAVAVAHDLGGRASLWLGTVFAKRVERTTAHPVPLRPTENGFLLGAAAENADAAARYVRAVNDALATPITAEDLSQAQALRRDAPALRAGTSAAEAAVAACDGELGDLGGLPSPTVAELERWRDIVRSRDSVAFAAVGPRPVLEAAATALRGTPSWPSRHALEDPWPARDVVGEGPSVANGQSLTIALRIADGEKALRAAAALGNRSSPLAIHVLALDHGWRIERVVGTLRVRGACLRVDLSSNEAEQPGARNAADVSALVLDEAARTLAESETGSWALDRAVLGQADPREAAGIAAWQALGGQLPPFAPRTFVSHTSASAGGTDANGSFVRFLSESRAARRAPSVDVRSATETGQEEAWMLLGSPCATYGEVGDDAGGSALAVRAVATEAPEIDGVRIEPWVSTDGIGLLAHGPRLDKSETAAHHMERIAGALGRALATTPLSDSATAAARARLENELSQEMDPLWPVALEALAPKHPSLLDPRGTWQSLNEISAHSVETARRLLVRGPLRLAALLGEADPHTRERVAIELERWLRPERTERSLCPPVPTLAARPGEYVVPAPPSDGPSSRALLAVPIPPSAGGGVPVEAEATAHLLNRTNGWLDRSVRIPGLAVFAQASVLGGGAGAALAVEITTTDRKAPEAVAQARALFQRLESGAATAEDVLLARSAAEDAIAHSSVDPRHRIVRLWTGRADPKAPDLASLRRFHRQVFAPERHVVVVTRPRP